MAADLDHGFWSQLGFFRQARADATGEQHHFHGQFPICAFMLIPARHASSTIYVRSHASTTAVLVSKAMALILADST
jgi:hypothetical protein